MSDDTLLFTGLGCILVLALVGLVTAGTFMFRLMLWWAA